jgi:UDP-glucose 4-epimerase
MPGIAGKVFNVGRGEACAILDLADMIGEILGVGVQPRFASAREGEVRHSCADVTRFAEQAGFQAQASLHEGLKATIMESGQ